MGISDIGVGHPHSRVQPLSGLSDHNSHVKKIRPFYYARHDSVSGAWYGAWRFIIIFVRSLINWCITGECNHYLFVLTCIDMS